MPYEDRARMASFYTNAFGWKAQMMGPEMGDYVVVHTTETDEQGMIQRPGAINGGFYKKSASAPSPSVVISVPDIHAAMQKVKDAGGQVVVGETGGEQSKSPASASTSRSSTPKATSSACSNRKACKETRKARP